MAEAVYRHRNETRTATLIRVPRDAVIADEPDDAELRAYHEANKESFMAPAYRAVTAIVLDPDQWLDRVETDPDDVRATYEARLEDFTIPATRRVRQVLFDDEAEARKLITRLETGAEITAAAEDVGKTVSDLGTVTRSQLPQPALAEVVFSLDEAGAAGPVETALGWHVLAVDRIEPEIVTAFEDVAEGLRREVAREIAVERLAEVGLWIIDSDTGAALLRRIGGD